ncbi:hypothetical protein ABT160_01260 [Streptomyces sp. NPDC001941]|uniref:hypothetical protein n=1 Tax=Streptomyces sp. NPDC001941 TaxID=3154659 RepID=UPI00332DC2A2
MGETTQSVRLIAQHASNVHWVRELPEKATLRDRFRRWVYPEEYQFDKEARPPKPWVDRPAGHYERTGWRIRAAYHADELAFEVEYVVCHPCRIAWVESPHTYEEYRRCGLAAAALAALREAYPDAQWHTAGGHFRESEPFWTRVGQGVAGEYAQRERCHHIEPRRAR